MFAETVSNGRCNRMKMGGPTTIRVLYKTDNIYLGSDLVSALTGLDVYDLPHGCLKMCRVKKVEKKIQMLREQWILGQNTTTASNATDK